MTRPAKPAKEALTTNQTMQEPNSPYGMLRAWVLKLPGVTTAPHRFGGTEFQVDGLEFMHSHGPSLLDIHLSKDDQARALKDGTALAHRYAPQAGWVSFRIAEEGDVEAAKNLVDLAFQNTKRALSQRHPNQTGR